MSMKRNIVIDGQEVPFKVSAAITQICRMRVLLLDREAVLNAVAGNIFPVCRESHYIQKGRFADLPAVFYVLIDNTN